MSTNLSEFIDDGADCGEQDRTVNQLADKNGRMEAILNILEEKITGAKGNILAKQSITNIYTLGKHQEKVEKTFEEGGENAVEKLLADDNFIKKLIIDIITEANKIYNIPRLGH